MPDAPISAAQPVATSKTWRTWLSTGLLVVLVFAAYFNSLNVPYVLDDQDSIPNNLSIRSFSTAFSPPSGQGATVSGRPVLNASFALNFALTGVKPLGFHLGNIIVHTRCARSFRGDPPNADSSYSWSPV